MSAGKPRPGTFGGASGCPAPDVLLSFHRATLSPDGRKEIIRHLRRCPACARNSKFVADALKDEKRLILGIEAFLPESKRRPRREGGFSRLVSRSRTPWPIAAAVAVAGIVLSLFVLFTPGRFSPAGRGMSSNADFSGPASGSTLLARRFSKQGDFLDRPYRSGLVSDSGAGGRQYVSLESYDILASFELSAKRDRDNELHGWSLAIYPAAARPNRAIMRR